MFGGITKEKNDEMKHLDNSSNLSLFGLQAFKARKKVEVNLHKKNQILYNTCKRSRQRKK